METQNGEEFLRFMVAKYCIKPKVVNTTDLSAYYHIGMGHFNKAIEHKKDKKEFGAYIELMRYADIIASIKTHKSYHMKKYKPQKELHQKRLSNVINELEQLKPELIQKYNNQYLKESNTFHCGICFVELQFEQVYTIKKCNHHYCKQCLMSYLKYESHVSPSTKPTCPQESCDTKLNDLHIIMDQSTNIFE